MFGERPSYQDRLKVFNTALLTPMARMFGEEEAAYTVLIRSTVLRYSGTVFFFYKSYVMEYNS